jgi:hypothetical protein
MFHGVLPDVYSIRHKAQKIYLRQRAALRWVVSRIQALQERRPSAVGMPESYFCDFQLRLVSTVLVPVFRPPWTRLDYRVGSFYTCPK